MTVLNMFHARRFGLLLGRAAVLLGVVVLVCVPALTRIGQKLEAASHTPSFSRTIDCPPKRVTVAPLLAIASPVPLGAFDGIPAGAIAPAAYMTPGSPHIGVPPPLRAPPSALLS